MAREKTKFGWFTVPEWEKEEKWLREQHKRGWKLIDATAPCFYRFEECEPEDVIYQLDYNEEGMRHRSDYIRMFHDCGWEYVTDMVGYAYFRKPAEAMEEDEGIFSDDESKFEMLQRVYKGRVRILIILFFLCVLPQVLMIGNWARLGPAGYIPCFLIGFVFALYLCIFIRFALAYWKTKK